MKPFLPIVITLPELYRNETDAYAALTACGAEILHFRKPEIPIGALSDFLRRVADPAIRQALTVHYHPELAQEHSLGGIHYRSVERPPQEGYRLSTSCHRWEELREHTGRADYVFLSPVFDSVSKPGYRSAFDGEELRKWLQTSDRPPVAALGGVTAGNIASIRSLGFESAACIGGVWVTDGDRIDIPATAKNYKRLKQAWTEAR